MLETIRVIKVNALTAFSAYPIPKAYEVNQQKFNCKFPTLGCRLIRIFPTPKKG